MGMKHTIILPDQQAQRERLRQLLIDSTTVLISIDGEKQKFHLRDISKVAKDFNTTVEKIMETEF